MGTFPRGRCLECGRMVPVRRNGLARVHLFSATPAGRGGPLECVGSGKPAELPRGQVEAIIVTARGGPAAINAALAVLERALGVTR